MFDASLYHIVYYVIISFITIICAFNYSRYPETRVDVSNNLSNQILPVIIISGLIIFIGLRPISGWFVDMMNYAESYNNILENNRGFFFDSQTSNLLFDNLFYYLASNYYEIVLFFFLIAFIYFFCIYYALKKIFPHDTLYALIIYLGAFSTYSYATNGIKAGAAAAIFILAIAFYKKPFISILLCLVSFGFHHSMTLPIFGYLAAALIKDPKWFFFAWLGCLFLSFFHISGITTFLSEFADDKGQEYLLQDGQMWGGKDGFRWDFILYGLPPILIGFWVIYIKSNSDRLYNLILKYYLATNAIWLLCMYVPYNNRIAYLSWFMLPIVVCYPFFKFKLSRRQYIQLNYIAFIYLGFTLFSFFI